MPTFSELGEGDFNLFATALESAFPTIGALRSLVRRHLSRSLDSITSAGGTLPEAIDGLLEWAEAQNRLAALLLGALKMAPHNLKLRDFAERRGFGEWLEPLPAAEPPHSRAARGPSRIQVAAGRLLPELLFVTSRAGLEQQVGAATTGRVLGALEERNLPLLDLAPGLATSAARRRIHACLRRLPRVQGVVILGGHGVIPLHRVDALPAALRGELDGRTRDQEPDRFVVWSDDPYADVDGDGLPDLPISRIPDGGSEELLLVAIQADCRAGSLPSYGVRNALRPFVDRIFATLPGARATAVLAQKRTPLPRPDPNLAADRVYLLLHGDEEDGTHFFGENRAGLFVALTLDHVPPRCGSVVFSGCDWAALIVDRPAARAALGEPLVPRTAGSSIALKFILGGVTAFVGSTGAHYSPTQEPYDYFGGRLHAAFWRRHNVGVPPARALFRAKREVWESIHTQSLAALPRAIELKLVSEFTCLGLGW